MDQTIFFTVIQEIDSFFSTAWSTNSSFHFHAFIYFNYVLKAVIYFSSCQVQIIHFTIPLAKIIYFKNIPPLRRLNGASPNVSMQGVNNNVQHGSLGLFQHILRPSTGYLHSYTAVLGREARATGLSHRITANSCRDLEAWGLQRHADRTSPGLVGPDVQPPLSPAVSCL